MATKRTRPRVTQRKGRARSPKRSTVKKAPGLKLGALLIGMMEGAFKEGTWQPSLWNAVKNLTVEQALWRPAPDRHNIWDLVDHVILWKKSAVDRVSAGRWSESIPDYGTLDWQPISGIDEEDWRAALGRLQAVHEKLLTVVRRKSDARLLGPYKGKTRSFPLYRLVEGAFTHDVYHAGQIRALAAAQGIQMSP